jgi:hypothetical protein
LRWSRFLLQKPREKSQHRLLGLVGIRTTKAMTGSFLQEKLPPVTAADPARLKQLLTDLDSDRFALRAKAFAELASLGELAEAALRKPLAKPPSLELQKRINQLLEKLDETHPERLQPVRAIQGLQLIGTAPGRQLLQILARGTPEARLTMKNGT